MKKEQISKDDIKLLGLSVRTNNKNEINPEMSKIGKLANRFMTEVVASRIQDQKNPGVIFSVYTDYDSDEQGEYTYFIGEEVSSFENAPADLQKLTIASAKYQKFTTPFGKMPEVVINAWQKIWKMSSDDFGGNRAYQADFEVYDERASDPANTSLDIYIGVE